MCNHVFTSISTLFYGEFNGNVCACANSVYQALFSAYALELGNEARFEAVSSPDCHVLPRTKNSLVTMVKFLGPRAEGDCIMMHNWRVEFTLVLRWRTNMWGCFHSARLGGS